MSLSDADHDLVVAELGREPTPRRGSLREPLERALRLSVLATAALGIRLRRRPGRRRSRRRRGCRRPPEPRRGGRRRRTSRWASRPQSPLVRRPVRRRCDAGVGGIVRDTAVHGCLPHRARGLAVLRRLRGEHSRYLMEGVVEGISHYGNCIGVPTVTGSTAFHGDYEGNPLVNVACIGLIGDPERMVTAEAQGPATNSSSSVTRRAGTTSAVPPSPARTWRKTPRRRTARRCRSGTPTPRSSSSEANEQLVDGDLIESRSGPGRRGPRRRAPRWSPRPASARTSNSRTSTIVSRT